MSDCKTDQGCMPSYSDFINSCKSLMPIGEIWDECANPVMWSFYQILFDEFYELHIKQCGLLSELNPCSSSLYKRWGNMSNFPESCSSLKSSDQLCQYLSLVFSENYTVGSIGFIKKLLVILELDYIDVREHQHDFGCANEICSMKLGIDQSYVIVDVPEIPVKDVGVLKSGRCCGDSGCQLSMSANPYKNILCAVNNFVADDIKVEVNVIT